MDELSICAPFVEKHIALINPTLLILVGGVATQALLDAQKGITRLRGQQFGYQNRYLSQDMDSFVTYHPSYLLRQPAQKRLAWQDMLHIRAILEEKGLPESYFAA